MKHLIPCLLLAIALPLSAQLLDAKNRDDRQIMITSDAMDVDMKNGKATFYGNVVVNDPEVIIQCDKMVLYQAKDKKKENGKADSGKDKKSNDGDVEKLDRIECIDNVIITRKNFQEDGKNQNGTCGKATYFHKLGKVTMEIEPVLYQGKNKITGTTLSFFQKSENVTGTDIKIEARDLQKEMKDRKTSDGKK